MKDLQGEEKEQSYGASVLSAHDTLCGPLCVQLSGSSLSFQSFEGSFGEKVP